MSKKLPLFQQCNINFVQTRQHALTAVDIPWALPQSIPDDVILGQQMKTLITDRTLRGLKRAPAGKRTVIWDTAVPGLCVRVTDKGAASFNVMRRVKGQTAPVRRMLGVAWTVPFPASVALPYPLATAREDARTMLLDMSRGIDPKTKAVAKIREDQARQANNFAAVAETFIQKHVRGLKSGHEVEATIRRELIDKWESKPIAEISRRDIAELIESVANDRKYQAFKIFAYANKLFGWAVARHIIETSPCAGIKISDLAGRKEPRQRVLNDVEIRALWKATEGLSYPAAPFVRLLLLTGQRLREVAEAQWQEFDLEKALWTIPPERMKGGAAHEVPLARTTVEILGKLPRWTGPFVFSTTGGERPISGFSKLKLKIDAAIAEPIAPWRFHDLRRTMRTGLGALPIPSNVCELCIAHAQPGLHQVYDRHSYRDEKQRAFELWAARVAEIVEPGGPDNVVRLKKA
jgi:integrase